MKKKWLILGAILFSLILITSLFFALKPKQNNIISISGAELLKKLENKETFILIRTQDGCHHCEQYKPILNRVLTENNLNAFELNSTTLNKENQSIRNEIDKLFNISGTPTTIFISNGIETTTINRIVGISTYTNVVEKLKEQGFLK